MNTELHEGIGCVSGVVVWVLAGNIIGGFKGAALGLLFAVIAFVLVSASLDHMENSREAQAQARRDTQAQLARLNGLLESSEAALATLPHLINVANRAFDQAESEFADGAFAPFWDAVEVGATSLATFNHTLRTLTDNASRHRAEAAPVLSMVRPFRLDRSLLPDPASTAERMRAIVRAAQRNFHFATIYEQRKTNRLLVEGFSSLGQALAELSDRLDVSLRELTAEVGQFREQCATASQQEREHERQERQMLDNIQRGRRPTP